MRDRFLEEASHVLDPHPVQGLRQLPGSLGDAAGAAVQHDPVLIHRRKVAAERDIAPLDRQPDPHRLKRPAPRVILIGVVTQQREVARVAAAPHPRRHRVHQPGLPFPHQPIERRRARRFQRREPIQLRHRPIPQPIADQQESMSAR